MTIVQKHNSSDDKANSLASVVQKALRTEADALIAASKGPTFDIERAILLIHESTGPLIVSGVGKSGHIARKIASTFRSLGKRSAFLHAAEASHGDLGIIHHDSVVLVLSNSGETTELSDLLAYCLEYRISVISITASAESTLGRASEVVVAHGPVEEACVNGLAPTTSTTLALAIGDALAVGVSHLSGVEPQSFRRYHPGGKLGARLLKVGDLMHTDRAMPTVPPEMEMQEVVIVMSAKGFGTVIVVENDRLYGVITDGDMRRNVTRLWQSCAKDLAQRAPRTVSPDTTAANALRLMNDDGITSVVVSDESRRIHGILHIHDCLRAGVDV